MPQHLDASTRLDITDRINLYMHLIDSNQGEAWLSLFTNDAVVKIGPAQHSGTVQLHKLVESTQALGKGTLRHQLTNIVVTAGEVEGTAKAIAYGLVTEWQKGFNPIGFMDYTFIFRHEEGQWQIAEAHANPVLPPQS